MIKISSKPVRTFAGSLSRTTRRGWSRQQEPSTLCSRLGGGGNFTLYEKKSPNQLCWLWEYIAIPTISPPPPTISVTFLVNGQAIGTGENLRGGGGDWKFMRKKRAQNQLCWQKTYEGWLQENKAQVSCFCSTVSHPSLQEGEVLRNINSTGTTYHMHESDTSLKASLDKRPRKPPTLQTQKKTPNTPDSKKKLQHTLYAQI